VEPKVGRESNKSNLAAMITSKEILRTQKEEDRFFFPKSLHTVDSIQACLVQRHNIIYLKRTAFSK
jgi:hypothetical protein